ncbi:hypothetical protein GCM10009836_49970 [Pseudonocardia ailaonensis]|uniref:Uncharacterized protein n=1 Tax=Pseudonocardia ailaonensis TaxID=367279 RepID=A0ABN2NDR9_9PSEU
MLALATQHDAGFDDSAFTVSLRAVRRLPEAEFTAYGLSGSEAQALVGRMLAWAGTLDGRGKKGDVRS